jgi:hypothetical protein
MAAMRASTFFALDFWSTLKPAPHVSQAAGMFLAIMSIDNVRTDPHPQRNRITGNSNGAN